MKSTKATKTNTGKPLKKIGVSFGVTLNLENYESSRIDVWEEDYIEDDSQREEAYENLWKRVTDQVQSMADLILNGEQEPPKNKAKTKRKSR